LPMNRKHSFNNTKYLSNLKKLNQNQYFKKTHSYYSCRVKHTMLRFRHSHCHLYGLRLVGSPPIAITSVLKSQDVDHALSILQI
jgi:hypothetical protein